MINSSQIIASVISVVIACNIFAAEQGKIPPAKAAIGINLAGPCDWNTELPFVDVFHMSRTWISQKKGEKWGQGSQLDLDEKGWVKSLQPDCWAETPLCTINGGHYPAGEYTVLYQGEGDIEFWGSAKPVNKTPGQITIKVDPAGGPIWLRLKKTDPNNYIRDIKVIMPGFLETYKDNPWHPVFLKRWQGMACLRFMDFMHTNGSKVKSWQDRPKVDDATYSHGIPLELMIDLSNRLKIDPWFCMPHLADDDYIRNFARMVKEKLDPSLKIYIEYSNEVWNGQFEQSRYAGKKGQELKFAEKPWEAGWKYTGYRSTQIFKIWEEVFGGTDRLLRVLASQAANSYVSERIVEFQDAYKNADALAIAPYISCNVRPGGKPAAEEVEKWSVEQALDYMKNSALPQSVKWIEKSKQVADKFGLKLIAYEGGQHMVGVQGGENNQKIEKLFHQVNAHPEMGNIYTQYYDAWEKAGGDLFCSFSSVGKWSKWGSWGLLQYYDDDPKQSPKFMATINQAGKQRAENSKEAPGK